MKKVSNHQYWKPLLLGVIALGAGLWATRADYSSEVTSRNPISYYRLNETITTTSTAVNAGSLGAPGDGAYGSLVAHPTGGALPSQTGNGAANFFVPTEASVAANSGVTIPFNAALNVAGPFTFEFWAKPADTTTRCTASSIVLGDSGWLFYNSLTAGQWTFRTINASSANVNATGGAVTVGAWQHVVGVWDGTQNILYVNGVPVATNASATFKAVTNTAIPLTLGIRSDTGFNFKGSLDEAAYYSSALSAARILAHYQAGTNPAPATAYEVEVGNDNPVGYWRLNDGVMAVNSGTRGVAANGGYIGSAATGTGPQPTAQPGFETTNSAVTLTSASTSWVGLGTGASLNGTTDFSVSAWVKTTSTNQGIIVQQRDASPGGYNGQYKLFMNADGTAHFWVYNGGFQFDFSTFTPINDGNWHQIVAVRKGAEGYLYVDDQFPVSASGTLLPLDGTLQTYIGRDMRDSVDPFDGSIDEVAIFDRALNQATAQSLYYTGMGSNTVFMVTDPPTLSPAGTIYATTTFTLTADAGGALPLTYQWRLNGTNVGSPSSLPIYTKENCSTEDTGFYDVVVSNPFGGSVTSAQVYVFVDPSVAASVGTPPQSVAIYSNYDASFTVVPAGTPPFTYQWKHEGTNLPNATNATLILTQCGADQLGAYTVGVSNFLGGAVSDPATLSFITPASLYEGTVTGKRPWAFWRLNDGLFAATATNIGLVSVANGVVGATASASYGPELTTGQDDLQSPAFAGMESNNTVTVFSGTAAGTPNPYGSIDAGTASSLSGTNDFTVLAWVKTSANPATDAVVVQQRDESGEGYVGQYRFFIRTDGRLQFFIYGRNIAGGNENFQFDVTSSAAITDGNWHLVSASRQGLTGRIYVDGIQVGTATGTELKALNAARKVYIGRDGRDPNFLAGLNGSMDEVAIFARALPLGEVQEIFSIGKYASVLTPAFVTQQPAPLTRYAGASATFSIVAGGSEPLTYQWLKNGTNIVGATNANLTLTGVTALDAGNYSCTVSNALPVGAVSSTAALTVITLPPGTHGANVGALGPLAYWRLNETNFETAAADLVGGHNAAYEGLIIQGVDGPTSVSFDAGNTGYFFDGGVPSDLNAGSIGAMDGYIDFTVSLWVRTTNATESALIVQRDSTPVGYNGAYRLTMLTNGNLSLDVYRLEDGGSQFAGSLATTSTPVNDGNWHHIVAIRQGTNGFIYVDGVLAASASGTFVASLRSSNLTYIGRNERDNDQPFTGDLDEVALFDRALTPAEVADIAPVVTPPTLTITPSGPDVTVTWSAGTLLEATNITGPWVPSTNASPYTVPATNSMLFFKAQLP